MKKRNVLTDPNTFYDFSNEEKQSYLNYVKNKIKKHTLLSKMHNIVNRRMTGYKTDFYVHDTYIILNDDHKSKTFLWMVRDTGTDLINLNFDSSEDEKQALNWINACLSNSKHNVYLIDNNNLKRLGEYHNLNKEELLSLINNKLCNRRWKAEAII